MIIKYQLTLATASEDAIHPDTYVMKWANNSGGNQYNELSRSISSHSHLQVLNDSGGWYTLYEKKRYEQCQEVDLNNACPACPVGLIRGLDHNVFTIPQHVSLVKLLQLLDITRHNYGLATMVLLTQNQRGHATLTHEQQMETQNWLINEGEKVREKHNAVKGMKAKVVELLHSLEMYQTLIPSSFWENPVDYSLLLGGSIQQMQMRFIGMIAYYDNYGMPETYNGYRPYQPISRTLGEVTALTCDRVVNSDKQSDQELEVDEKYDTVWFEVGRDGMVDISHHKRSHVSDLTEDTAYRAIVHSVRRMCNDEHYFERHKRSQEGFHPEKHLQEESLTSYLYRYNDYAYELTDDFRKASCRFLSEYQDHPKPFMTKQQLKGASDIKRPTTKQTVREWMKARLPCKGKKNCNILTISSQPNARYQQLAVLQGVEEEINNPYPTKILVSIAAFGASTNIPTNEALDNLSRTLFMIQRRPER